MNCSTYTNEVWYNTYILTISTWIIDFLDEAFKYGYGENF
jgi:hypothetical protein